MSETKAGIENLTTDVDGDREPTADSCTCCQAAEAEREQPAAKETVTVRTPYTQQFGSFS